LREGGNVDFEISCWGGLCYALAMLCSALLSNSILRTICYFWLGFSIGFSVLDCSLSLSLSHLTFSQLNAGSIRSSSRLCSVSIGLSAFVFVVIYHLSISFFFGRRFKECQSCVFGDEFLGFVYPPWVRGPLRRENKEDVAGRNKETKTRLASCGPWEANLLDAERNTGDSENETMLVNDWKQNNAFELRRAAGPSRLPGCFCSFWFFGSLGGRSRRQLWKGYAMNAGMSREDRKKLRRVDGDLASLAGPWEESFDSLQLSYLGRLTGPSSSSQYGYICACVLPDASNRWRACSM
jgi:hypothetical protein